MLNGWSWPLLSWAVASVLQCASASALWPPVWHDQQLLTQDQHVSYPQHDDGWGRPAPRVTVDFEVTAPVAVSADRLCATQVLMKHTFGQSYGIPFTAFYEPPRRERCDFNRVVINLTVTSRGRQFDRLATMWLSDFEVFRTSTAEPTRDGIVWTYIKDMSAYMALWTQPQRFIFELDNNVDSTYTGLYNTTLTAAFYRDARPPVVADAILPISTRMGSAGLQSIFRIPEQIASVQHSIPPNVTRAAVSIAANGQIDEEFWYSNVFSSQALTFNSTAGPLLSGGPFREIQLLIDGHLAGVVWPFPVIFTGGVVPSLWSPIVGIQAFDLVETEIDITPFLPYLMDGQPHSFTIEVFQLADDGDGAASLTLVEDFWLVSGKIWLFCENRSRSAAARVGGSNALPTISGGGAPDIGIASHITTHANGSNATLSYLTDAQRALRVSSPAGLWEQKLSYTNRGLVSAAGFNQSNTQDTTGSHSSTNALDPRFSQQLDYGYAISLNASFVNAGDASLIDASLRRGFRFVDSGRPDLSLFSLVAGPASEDTTQKGRGHYSSDTSKRANFGTTSQTFKKKTAVGSYSRHVDAFNGSLLKYPEYDLLARATTAATAMATGPLGGQGQTDPEPERPLIE